MTSSSFTEMPMILASASPRRRDLMQKAGYEFAIMASNVEELHDERAGLHELTMANAKAKAQHIARLQPGRLVIGADTLVAIDGTALTKPADMNEAREMIARLNGRTHEVCTSVALLCEAAGVMRCFEVVTLVTFKQLDEAERDDYLALINPLDKAGGYAAQEHGDRIIAAVDGSWSNVVGLPMEALAVELAALGVIAKKETGALRQPVSP